MSPKEDTTDEPEDLTEGVSEEEHLDTDHHGRKRRRIKVRRRIRIKKRSSPKKKARKTMETIAWILIIAAFVMTLIILVLQLDLNDKRTKKSLGKEVSRVIGKHNSHQNLASTNKVSNALRF